MGNCSKIPRTSSSENLQQPRNANSNSGFSQINLNSANRAAPLNNPNASPNYQQAPNFAANSSNLLPQQPINYQVPMPRPMPVNNLHMNPPPSYQSVINQQRPPQPVAYNSNQPNVVSGYPPPANYNPQMMPPQQMRYPGYPPANQNPHGYSQPPLNQQNPNISSIPLNQAHGQISGNLKVNSGKTLVCNCRFLNNTLQFQLSDDGKLHWVDFEYSAKFQSTFIMNFMGIEYYDKNTISHRIHPDNKYKSEPQRFIIEPTQKGFFSKKYKVNLSALSKNDLEVIDKCTFPIIIEITSTDTTGESQTLISCFKILKEGDNYSGVMVKQTIKALNKYYPLLNLYGTSTDSQESECLICLTELKTIAVLPCRHVCYCEACVNEVKSKNKTDCPVCRSPVQSFLNVKHN